MLTNNKHTMILFKENHHRRRLLTIRHQYQHPKRKTLLGKTTKYYLEGNNYNYMFDKI